MENSKKSVNFNGKFLCLIASKGNNTVQNHKRMPKIDRINFKHEKIVINQ